MRREAKQSSGTFNSKRFSIKLLTVHKSISSKISISKTATDHASTAPCARAVNATATSSPTAIELSTRTVCHLPFTSFTRKIIKPNSPARRRVITVARLAFDGNKQARRHRRQYRRSGKINRHSLPFISSRRNQVRIGQYGFPPNR